MEENSNWSHNIYKSDPLLFKSYIGMEVDILTIDGITTFGIVYTVDPVSESVVLLQTCQHNRLKIIFGHAIKNINIRSDKPCDLPELFMNTPKNLFQSSLEERKSAVIKMLQQNRFSVKEEEDILTIENVLSIKPPYESRDCICANSIILGRIQNLLSRIQT
ncbi:gem-associated protein 6 [Ptiloglossa arizonensis]|uniref:gem-associated protein 6 n=1 Tax=Ptiloglossa arizonensis TaxID=3350558 RepID=UPI003FA115F4